MSSRIIAIALGISVALAYGLLLAGQTQAIAATAAITLFTAILWVSEALPIPVTSLIPFFAFPMAGVLSHSEAASALGNHVIILLMGAFMLPVATAPNAIVYGTDKFSIKTMAREGFALNIILAFVITAVVSVTVG